MNNCVLPKKLLKASLLFGLAPFVNAALATEQKTEEANDNETEHIVVTGSRLKPIHLEGASPVTVFDRERIEKSGASSLSELLQTTILNSFGARKSGAGSTGGTQGQATVNLRGLGEQRTLVLINGRRIANSAAIPDSQNINLIPISAIKRIEILRDGASSVYGSDAIGGVVNIILYKNRNEHQLSIALNRPQSAGGDINTIELSGGISNTNANLTYALSHVDQQALYHRDFEITQFGWSPFGSPGSYTAFTTAPDSDKILGVTMPDNRCPTAENPNDSFPRSQLINNQCQYNYADISSSQPESTFDSIVLDGNLDISDNHAIFAHLLLSRNSTDGVSAPTPHAGGIPYLPTMSANNPNNPTLGQTLSFDSNGDGIADTEIAGPFDLDIYYRNTAIGPRKRSVVDEMLSSQLGWQFDIDKHNTKVEFSLFYDRNTSDEQTVGLSRRDLLQNAINDGSFDIFAVNGETDINLAKSFQFDTDFYAKFESKGVRGHYQFDWFNKRLNQQDTILGFEYINYDYTSTFKDELTGNQLDGRAGGGNAKGDRSVFSLYGETNYPLTANLAMNLAMRYDRYSDFGSTFNPRLGLVYKMSDNWIIRSSLSSGFRAPSLFELFSDKNQGFTSVVDELRCSNADIDANGVIDKEQSGFEFTNAHPCIPSRVQTITQGNPDLDAEKSNSFTLGTLYQPDNNFRVSFSFYAQEFTDQILRLPADEVTMRELRQGSSDRIHRNSNGVIQSIDLNYDNFSGVNTEGIDLELTHTLFDNSTGRWGYFINASVVTKHEVELIKGEGFNSIEGEAGTPDGRAEFGIDWQRNNIDARLKINYIPATERGQVNFDSWMLSELHINWKTPWHGRLSAGVINVFDTKPPHDENWGFPYYDGSLFALQGRVPYIKYTHSF